MPFKPKETTVWTLTQKIIDNHGIPCELHQDVILSDYVREGWEILHIAVVPAFAHEVLRIATLIYRVEEKNDD